MLKTDKILHFICSFIIAAFFAIIAKSISPNVTSIVCGIFGVIVSITVGIIKEIYDKFSGRTFDWQDIIADGLGCLLALIFSIFM